MHSQIQTSSRARVQVAVAIMCITFHFSSMPFSKRPNKLPIEWLNGQTRAEALDVSVTEAQVQGRGDYKTVSRRSGSAFHFVFASVHHKSSSSGRAVLRAALVTYELEIATSFWCGERGDGGPRTGHGQDSDASDTDFGCDCGRVECRTVGVCCQRRCRSQHVLTCMKFLR